MWQNYINAFLGLVVLVISFLGLTDTTLTWTLFVLGGVIFTLGAWGATRLPDDARQMHA